MQAAAPLKDSGNDLIAVRGEHFKAVSVRTSTTDTYSKPNADRMYHVLAVVELVDDEHQVYLDRSRIFLLARRDVEGASTRLADLGPYEMSLDRVAALFGG